MLLLPGDEYSMVHDGYYNFARTLPDCRYCAARSATSMAAPTLEIYLAVSIPFVCVIAPPWIHSPYTSKPVRMDDSHLPPFARFLHNWQAGLPAIANLSLLQLDSWPALPTRSHTDIDRDYVNVAPCPAVLG